MTNEDVQIFIGSNGSGKSSLLRECNPFPPVRSDFEKKEMKVVTIEHKGVIYILTTDFSNHHSIDSGLNSDVLCLDEANVLVQDSYNEHVK